MTFLVVHGSGGIPNPLFTFSQGCKAVPPGCKAEVVGGELKFYMCKIQTAAADWVVNIIVWIF